MSETYSTRPDAQWTDRRIGRRILTSDVLTATVAGSTEAMAAIDHIVLTATPTTDEQQPPAPGELLFIGTATVLLRWGSLRVLTDPNFLHQGEHAPLGYGLRSKRLTQPALTVEELPPIDVVVLSHHHGDHFDQRAADGLDKDVAVLTTAHAARKLGRQGFRHARGLETWESVEVTKGATSMRVTALPAIHAPMPLRALLPPVMGSLLEFSDLTPGAEATSTIYVSGDTLVFDELNEIARRHPDIDLALVHLGGTRIFGIQLTMDGRDGVRALRIIEPRDAIPIHYDDYSVFRSSLAEFRAAVDAAELTTNVHYLERGETFTL